MFFLLDRIVSLFYKYIFNINYPMPKNNTNYFFYIVIIFLLLEIVTGLFLSIYYVPHTDSAFESILKIEQDISLGWVFKRIHECSSEIYFFFFFVIVFEGIYFKRYTTIKSIYSWVLGIFLILSFFFIILLGRVLPWNIVSGYTAIILTNIFSVFGDSAVYLLWGGFSINSTTLNRFFFLHYLLPFICVVLVLIYLFLFFTPKEVSSNHFNKYQTFFFFKDITIFFLMLFLSIIFVFFKPFLFFSKTVWLSWYLLPFFTILSSFIRWDYGAVYFFFTFFIVIILPRLDLHSKRYVYTDSALSKVMFWFFTFNFIFLGYLGSVPVYCTELIIFCTWLHFFYLLFIMPFCFMFDVFTIGVYKKKKTIPTRIEIYWRDLLRQDDYDNLRWDLFTIIFEKTAIDVIKILKRQKSKTLLNFINSHKNEAGATRNYWVQEFLKSRPLKRRKKKANETFFKHKNKH